MCLALLHPLPALKRQWNALILAALVVPATVAAQGARDFDTVVDEYVAEGLRTNLALQTENLEVEKATQALAEARMNALEPNLFEASKDGMGDDAEPDEDDEA